MDGVVQFSTFDWRFSLLINPSNTHSKSLTEKIRLIDNWLRKSSLSCNHPSQNPRISSYMHPSKVCLHTLVYLPSRFPYYFHLTILSHLLALHHHHIMVASWLVHHLVHSFISLILSFLSYCKQLWQFWQLFYKKISFFGQYLLKKTEETLLKNRFSQNGKKLKQQNYWYYRDDFNVLTLHFLLPTYWYTSTKLDQEFTHQLALGGPP